MKKLFVALISAVLCFSLFAFIGCDENEKPPEDRFANMQVGDQVSTYPDCEFNYKCVRKDGSNFVIHISQFSVTLSEINSITPNDTLEGIIYPCLYTVVVKGTADSSLSGTSLTVALWCSYGSTLRSKIIESTTIQDDGSIVWELRWQVTEIDKVYIVEITAS